MGFGGGQKVKPTVIPPTRVEPDLEMAKADMRERLRRQRSRASSRVSDGALQKSALFKPELKDTLG